MLRFPNPGSDVDGFIRIYQEIFEALRESTTFGLDDMTRVLVERNLATSSGYMGEEALERSFRKDRSRDPLYNQSKMYSELYKVLGWLHPTPESALRFRFTYLGAHVAAARHDPASIMKESLLGIAYPNALLGVKGSYVLRPFATILRTMAALDGLLSRDEMIVGPLSLEDDTLRAPFDAMTAELRSVRKDWVHMDAKLKAVSRERGITATTMGNYTRFPIAVMKWSGWAYSQRRKDYYGKALPYLVLTAKGRQMVERIESLRDLRASDIEGLDERAKSAIVRVAFYQMLDRSGFSIESVRSQFTSDSLRIARSLGDARQLLFSPFQDLDPQYVTPMFPKVAGTKVREASRLDAHVTSAMLPQLASDVSLSDAGTADGTRVHDDLASQFADAAQRVGADPSKIADYIAEAYRESNKDEFYPLVARLFRALGYDCDYSRPGVNYQRYDAIIIDPEYSIPIEIKSPGEEEFLSVKAVRQALENKVILLSRRAFPTRRNITSLVVGYNPPNNRSEVASLVDNIVATFGIVIGVVDLRSLLRLVAATILQGKRHNSEELRTLRGIIRVANS